MITLYTIGFTKKTAKDFFEILIKNNVRKIIDIRLNNTSQLAGFTQEKNLKYFLKTICDIEYIYMPQYSPSNELLNLYKNKKISWEEYAKNYLDILIKRGITKNIDFGLFKSSCLLCSESEPDNCHRKLLADYLVQHNNDIKIKHL